MRNISWFVHYLNDEAIIFWTHQLPPYSCLCLCDKIGIIWNFVSSFSVYSHSLWYDVLSAPMTCVGLILLHHTMELPLGFPTHTSHQNFLSNFPSFPFFLLYFLCVCFLELSSSFLLLEILVSLFFKTSSFSLFSLVRLDCLSISFFFTCICGFLVTRGGGHPQVGNFLGRDCPFGDILILLFLVIPQSVSFTQLLSRMLGEGEVRSS